ncbi:MULTISPECIES: ATP-grasp domain-containing protein [unclassified Streptomyces]|uniref:ATP-grasp domain-containing protein n=1 Tax=unclassified Streptomyces TaxID=2593676 RepID=UPI0040426503
MSGEVGQDRTFVVEECLLGSPAAAGEGWGDYVSVEQLVHRGAVRASCVTGKLPLAEPFQETGFFIPSTLAPDLLDQVVRLATDAVRALGIRDAVTHTEVKLTPSGPRIIEVNGRAGGHVVDIVPRACRGSLVTAALELALGRLPDTEAFRFTDVTFEWVLLPPVDARELISLYGADDARALEGVTAVDVHARPGEPIDWRLGNQTLGLVHGQVADHAALRRLVERLERTVGGTYERMG